MNAEPKKVPRYPRHSLTPDGTLYTDGEPAKVFIGRNGYLQAYLHRGKRKTRHPKMIYKLMAVTYLPPRPSKKHVIRHLDGDCNNNHVDNLAWGTQKQNMQDLKKHKVSRTDFTPELEKEVLGELKKGTSRESLYKKHNISFLTVNRLYWALKDIGKNT